MSRGREAPKTNAIGRPRTTVINEAGLAYLQKMIVDLVCTEAFYSDIIFIRRNRHDPAPPHWQSFEFQEQLADQIHVPFHKRRLTTSG